MKEKKKTSKKGCKSTHDVILFGNLDKDLDYTLLITIFPFKKKQNKDGQ